MKTDLLDIQNCDCMDLMAEYEDGHFDLAIVDPPYGIWASRPSRKPNNVKQRSGKKLSVKTNYYQHKDWDDNPANSEYFYQLQRVSKNQIIWGVNYFSYNLIGGRIVWDKLNGESDQFDCEIAFNSLNNRTDIVRFMWSGMIQGINASRLVSKANTQQGNKKNNERRIHPTQKPVALYKWLLRNYAKEGDKILDTHMGSGSIAIACHYMGFNLTACELDPDYYKAACERIDRETRQISLF